MIVIRIDKPKQHIIFEGHADFAKEGHDVVCASVSAAMMTLRSVLLKCNIDHSFGVTGKPYVEIKIRSNTKYARGIFKGVCELLEAIMHDYPKNVTIAEKELVTGIDTTQ